MRRRPELAGGFPLLAIACLSRREQCPFAKVPRAIKLLIKIVLGERLGNGYRRGSLWWLSALSALAAAFAASAGLSALWERVAGFSLLDSHGGVFAMLPLSWLLLIAIIAIFIKTFARSPHWLIAIATATWAGAAWVIYRTKF